MLRLIQFDPSKEQSVFEALSRVSESIHYVAPGQYIISKEECDYLKSQGIDYRIIADIDKNTYNVTKMYA